MARKLIAMISTGGRSSKEIHRDIDKALREKMPELYKKKDKNDDKKRLKKEM
jgi:hypothetical protein